MFKPPHIYQWIDFLGLFEGHTAEITPHFSGYPAVICPAGVLLHIHTGEIVSTCFVWTFRENPSNFRRKHIMLFFSHIFLDQFSVRVITMFQDAHTTGYIRRCAKNHQWWLWWDISGGQDFQPDGHRFRGRYALFFGYLKSDPYLLKLLQPGH